MCHCPCASYGIVVWPNLKLTITTQSPVHSVRTLDAWEIYSFLHSHFFTWNLIQSALCDSLGKKYKIKKPIFLFCHQKNVIETQMDLTKICVVPSLWNNQMKTLKLFYPLPSIIIFCSIFYYFFSHKELVSTCFSLASYVLTPIQVQPDNPPITTNFFFFIENRQLIVPTKV